MDSQPSNIPLLTVPPAYSASGPNEQTSHTSSHTSRFHLPTKKAAEPTDYSETEYPSGSYSKIPDAHGISAPGDDPFLAGVKGFKTKRYGILRIVSAWTLEIWSFVLAFAMIFAIIGTTYQHDGKPLPQWPLNLSINALVAAFVVLFKASMVLVVAEGLGQLKWLWFSEARPLKDLQTYDDASRGPLGALRLMWVLRGRHMASTLAAFLVVVLLIVDPLSQLLIRYVSCQSIDLNLNATVPRSNSYDRIGGVHIGAGLYNAPGPMQAAINNGVFNPGMSQVAFNCPTGNCTFTGMASTIGYCSNCSDVSSEVNITSSDDVKNFTLPSGLTATPGMRTFVMGRGVVSGLEAIYARISEADCSEGEDSWACREFGAARCDIKPCVHSFSANIAGGNLTEEKGPVGATDDDSWSIGDNYSIYTVNLDCAGGAARESFQKAGYNIDSNTQWVAYNTSNSSDISYNPDCQFRFGVGALQSINFFLADYFSGEVPYAPKVIGGSSQLQQIFQEGNITYNRFVSVFENVTNAMTESMRHDGNATESQPFVGRVLRTETCVKVRWAWLTMPAVIVVLVGIFFITMIIETRKMEGGGRFYKSSILPLLFHGLDAPQQQQMNTKLTERSKMDNEAETLKVKLIDSYDQGLRFVHTNPSHDHQ